MKFLAGGFGVAFLGIIMVGIIHLINKFSENFGEYGFYIGIFLILFIIGGIAGSTTEIEEDKNK